MLMADTAVFDHIRRTLSDLAGSAPNRASAVSLEAALRSVTSHPLDGSPDAVIPDPAAARQALSDLLVLVSHSQWRFSGYHRRKLTICAMWLRTANGTGTTAYGRLPLPASTSCFRGPRRPSAFRGLRADSSSQEMLLGDPRNAVAPMLHRLQRRLPLEGASYADVTICLRREVLTGDD